MEGENIKKTIKNKRTGNWSSHETVLFIELCKEEKILEKMDGKRFRWAEVLIPVKEKMENSEFKFTRDVTQLTVKLKALRTEYRKAQEQNGTSGAAPSKFLFFNEMEDLLGSRPRNVFPLTCGKEVISLNGRFIKIHFKKIK